MSVQTVRIHAHLCIDIEYAEVMFMLKDKTRTRLRKLGVKLIAAAMIIVGLAFIADLGFARWWRASTTTSATPPSPR